MWVWRYEIDGYGKWKGYWGIYVWYAHIDTPSKRTQRLERTGRKRRRWWWWCRDEVTVLIRFLEIPRALARMQSIYYTGPDTDACISQHKATSSHPHKDRRPHYRAPCSQTPQAHALRVCACCAPHVAVWLILLAHSHFTWIKYTYRIHAQHARDDFNMWFYNNDNHKRIQNAFCAQRVVFFSLLFVSSQLDNIKSRTFNKSRFNCSVCVLLSLFSGDREFTE